MDGARPSGGAGLKVGVQRLTNRGLPRNPERVTGVAKYDHPDECSSGPPGPQLGARNLVPHAAHFQCPVGILPSDQESRSVEAQLAAGTNDMDPPVRMVHGSAHRACSLRPKLDTVRPNSACSYGARQGTSCVFPTPKVGQREAKVSRFAPIVSVSWLLT